MRLSIRTGGLRYDARMAEDLTGVPTGQWEDLRSRVRDLAVMVGLMWAAFVLLLIVLVRRGVLVIPGLPAAWHE